MGVRPSYIFWANLTPFFRQWDTWPGYDAWSQANNRKSPLLRAACADPAYRALADKLFELTGIEKLDPADGPPQGSAEAEEWMLARASRGRDCH